MDLLDKYIPEKQIERYVFSLKACIGRGTSGIVYVGKDTLTNSPVAIKVVNISQLDTDYAWKQLCQEVKIMKSLSHKHIVKLLDVFQTKNNAYIISEFCKNGDLRQYLEKTKIKFNEALDIIKQITSGMAELTDKGIIHRDLKPANILIDDGVYKISDFGFARNLSSFSEELMESLVGTPLYMAPQILHKVPYSSKCDIFSLGLVFYELLFGRTPWPAKTLVQLIDSMEQQPLSFPNYPELPRELNELLQQCLSFQEQDRPNLQQICEYFEVNHHKDNLNSEKNKQEYNSNIMQQILCQSPQQKEKCYRKYSNNSDSDGNQPNIMFSPSKMSQFSASPRNINTSPLSNRRTDQRILPSKCLFSQPKEEKQIDLQKRQDSPGEFKVTKGSSKDISERNDQETQGSFNSFNKDTYNPSITTEPTSNNYQQIQQLAPKRDYELVVIDPPVLSGQPQYPQLFPSKKKVSFGQNSRFRSTSMHETNFIFDRNSPTTTAGYNSSKRSFFVPQQQKTATTTTITEANTQQKDQDNQLSHVQQIQCDYPSNDAYSIPHETNIDSLKDQNCKNYQLKQYKINIFSDEQSFFQDDQLQTQQNNQHQQCSSLKKITENPSSSSSSKQQQQQQQQLNYLELRPSLSERKTSTDRTKQNISYTSQYVNQTSSTNNSNTPDIAQIELVMQKSNISNDNYTLQYPNRSSNHFQTTKQAGVSLSPRKQQGIKLQQQSSSIEFNKVSKNNNNNNNNNLNQQSHRNDSPISNNSNNNKSKDYRPPSLLKSPSNKYSLELRKQHNSPIKTQQHLQSNIIDIPKDFSPVRQDCSNKNKTNISPLSPNKSRNYYGIFSQSPRKTSKEDHRNNNNNTNPLNAGTTQENLRSNGSNSSLMNNTCISLNKQKKTTSNGEIILTEKHNNDKSNSQSHQSNKCSTGISPTYISNSKASTKILSQLQSIKEMNKLINSHEQQWNSRHSTENSESLEQQQHQQKQNGKQLYIKTNSTKQSQLQQQSLSTASSRKQSYDHEELIKIIQNLLDMCDHLKELRNQLINSLIDLQEWFPLQKLLFLIAKHENIEFQVLKQELAYDNNNSVFSQLLDNWNSFKILVDDDEDNNCNDNYDSQAFTRLLDVIQMKSKLTEDMFREQRIKIERNQLLVDAVKQDFYFAKVLSETETKDSLNFFFAIYTLLKTVITKVYQVYLGQKIQQQQSQHKVDINNISSKNQSVCILPIQCLSKLVEYLQLVKAIIAFKSHQISIAKSPALAEFIAPLSDNIAQLQKTLVLKMVKLDILQKESTR